MWYFFVVTKHHKLDVTVLIVFAKVEKGNGAFEYLKTWHDKENYFSGDLGVIGIECIYTPPFANYAWLHSYYVQGHGYLPHMGLPMGQKLVKSGSSWARLCEPVHLWNRWMDLYHLKFYGIA